jgi:hypothetical protein
LLFTHFSLHFFVSEHFSNVCLASSPKHMGTFPSQNPSWSLLVSISLLDCPNKPSSWVSVTCIYISYKIPLAFQADMTQWGCTWGDGRGHL